MFAELARLANQPPGEAEFQTGCVKAIWNHVEAETIETSIFLARIIGPLFVLVGAGVLLNTKHYGTIATAFLKNSDVYHFSGATGLVAGMAIVVHQNGGTIKTTRSTAERTERAEFLLDMCQREPTGVVAIMNAG